MRLTVKIHFFAALLLVAPYSFSSNLYKYQYAPSGSPTYVTPELACDNIINDGHVSTYQYIIGYNAPWCEVNGSFGFAQHRIVSTIGTCPVGYIDNGSGQCIEDFQCPSSGETTTFYSSYIDYPSSGESVSIDGCEVNLTSLVSSYITSTILPDGNNDIQVEWIGTYTGNESSSNVFTPSEQSTPLDTNSTIDSISNVDYNYGAPTTLQDGSITQTDIKTYSELVDSGVSFIQDSNGNYQILSTTGTNTLTIETSTTITQIDGSATETVQTDTSVSTPSTTVTNLNTDGSKISTTTNSATTNYNSTVINNYDSNGNLTGSQTTQSGIQTESSENDGNCGAPNQPACNVVLSDNSSDYEQQQIIDSLNSELQTKNNDISTDLSDTSNDYGASTVDGLSISNWFNRYNPFPASGSCSGEINTTIFGYQFHLAPCDPLQPLRDILAWVFFVLTLFTIMKIALGRKIL
jgi:hypothetical protein